MDFILIILLFTTIVLATWGIFSKIITGSFEFNNKKGDIIMVEKDEKNWEKYRKPKGDKLKKCCYLFGLCDIICFVFGALLLSLAIFSKCTAVACSIYCGCLGFLGLPMIALGFVIKSWTGRCCCCKSFYCCGDAKSDS